MKRGISIITWILVLTFGMSPVYSQYYSKTVRDAPKAEKVTNLHFFFHDTLGGKNPSAVLVARANITEVIGNAQGLWVSSGKDIPTLVAFFDFGFTKGEFNGSSISVFSRNPIVETERELAVVGGRGKFRMAKGFAQLKTYFLNVTNGYAIVEYNVTVIHH
ncbi:hypothetical protein REPUB_Repub01dG0226100 [Reevesia pubescens]